MEFIKLVQQKDQKSDNRIIIGTVLLVILIMSAIVFWPSGSSHRLLTFLPDNVSFYVHWTNKDYFNQSFLSNETLNREIEELKNVLSGDFLNLQEVLWFEIDNNSANNNYLLRFSRLPRSSVEKLQTRYPDFNIYSPQKNILLINKGNKIDDLQAAEPNGFNFAKGVSFYWVKNQAPQFLQDIAVFLEPAFYGDNILINWQSSQSQNRLALREQRPVDMYDIKYFLSPRDFDIALGFNSQLSETWSEQLSQEVLPSIFDSLPYYNLDKDVILERLLADSILWQKDDGWILASYQDFGLDILSFIQNLNVQEERAVLADGTAYIELVAAENQNIINHQIKGQTVRQIDKVFVVDIGQQHYLSNKLELIEQLLSTDYYLQDLFQSCGVLSDGKIGDFVYLNADVLSDGPLKNYLLANNLGNLQAFSYATGTISGINVCF